MVSGPDDAVLYDVLTGEPVTAATVLPPYGVLVTRAGKPGLDQTL